MKVMLDDSSLYDIGNAIREINGATVLYRPSEMADAIDEMPALIGDTHAYRITIHQSPHQTITVRKYLEKNEETHGGSFTTGEQFYRIQARIEADEGYTAGELNYPDELIVDRDYVIEASPATQIGE